MRPRASIHFSRSGSTLLSGSLEVSWPLSTLGSLRHVCLPGSKGTQKLRRGIAPFKRLKTKALKLWRRGELHCSSPLKLRKLFILRYAQYAKNAQIANRRYTAGTRNTVRDVSPFRLPARTREHDTSNSDICVGMNLRSQG